MEHRLNTHWTQIVGSNGHGTWIDRGLNANCIDIPTIEPKLVTKRIEHKLNTNSEWTQMEHGLNTGCTQIIVFRPDATQIEFGLNTDCTHHWFTNWAQIEHEPNINWAQIPQVNQIEHRLNKLWTWLAWFNRDWTLIEHETNYHRLYTNLLISPYWT